MNRMKQIGLILLMGWTASACKDKVRYRYTASTPVYTDYETFRSVGGWEAPKTIEKWGNIYY